MRSVKPWLMVGCLMTASAILPTQALSSLSVHPTSYAAVAEQGGLTTDVLHIRNDGPTSPLGYTVSDDREWLSEFPTSGQIIVGQQVEVTVSFDATGLAPGDYTGTITVLDPHHGPILIPATLTVNATTAVETGWSELTSGVGLAQSRPNPTSGGAEIAFRIPEEQAARLRLFDVSGREVATLFDGVASRGETRIAWTGADRSGRLLATGIYFYRLESPAGVLLRQLVVLR